MTQHLSKISKLFSDNHSISLTEEELKLINETVLVGNQEELQRIEERICTTQRTNCVAAVNEALDKYYHTGMKMEEVKVIVANVVENRAETPNITDTVRFLIVGT